MILILPEIRRLCFILTGLVLLFHCDATSIQEVISGCEIEEGNLSCLDLETECKDGFSQWGDTEAADGVKCQCCEKRDK